MPLAEWKKLGSREYSDGRQNWPQPGIWPGFLLAGRTTRCPPCSETEFRKSFRGARISWTDGISRLNRFRREALRVDLSLAKNWLGSTKKFRFPTPWPSMVLPLIEQTDCPDF